VPALPTLPWPVALALVLCLSALSGLVFGRSRTRLAGAWVVAACALVVPWLPPADELFARAVVALTSVLPVLRIVELTRDRRDWSAARRVWQFVSAFDTRETVRVAPRFDVRSAGIVIGHSALFAAGVAVARGAPEVVPGTWAAVVRFAAGVVSTYTLVGSAAAFTLVLYRALGIDLPPLQRTPIVSRSAQEFWGERWNRSVNRWLRRHCWAPLARRGSPRLGVVAAFVASGLLHFWIVFPALGLSPALLMASYFVVEGILVMAEGPLRVRRWPRIAAHAWTVAAVVGPAPLFIVPMTQLVAPS